MIHAEVQNTTGVPASSLSCDEDFNVELTILVKEKVPSIYGYVCVDRIKDHIRVFSSDSNDVVRKKLETLPLGISKLRLHFPKRMLAGGIYSVTLGWATPYRINNWTFDFNECCLKFELNDYVTR